MSKQKIPASPYDKERFSNAVFFTEGVYEDWIDYASKRNPKFAKELDALGVDHHDGEYDYETLCNLVRAELNSYHILDESSPSIPESLPLLRTAVLATERMQEERREKRRENAKNRRSNKKERKQ